MTPIDRHAVPVLHFSGGKDSLACLYLLERYWERLTVAWVNTGDAFPETVAMMPLVREKVGRFLEVKSEQPAQIARCGYPSDIVPMRNSDFGHAIGSAALPLIQPLSKCCADNQWRPMQQAMRDIGATLIIRGQRNGEARKGPVRTGQVIDGVEFWHPIEDWSADDVKRFLGDRLPSHYKYTDTSLDCMHCTAFLDENQGKMDYLRDFHASVHSDVCSRLRAIEHAVNEDLRHFRTALKG